ncbi:hypothetical protein GPECTOR_19g338 [Gonium pectorale]|uniref:Uncharacterized protein n=1 Tax=Gonium pectorale TaxID=33097 RepID=A0A150GJA5_GONPE|nr:hypothetical protein GPECTOR_19g338 [Gonium pectorale]|eukprot:KXZ49887.1 hypothetical protein GPECTOR_19g338 [Gonium pectorale]
MQHGPGAPSERGGEYLGAGEGPGPQQGTAPVLGVAKRGEGAAFDGEQDVEGIEEVDKKGRQDSNDLEVSEATAAQEASCERVKSTIGSDNGGPPVLQGLQQHQLAERDTAAEAAELYHEIFGTDSEEDDEDEEGDDEDEVSPEDQAALAAVLASVTRSRSFSRALTGSAQRLPSLAAAPQPHTAAASQRGALASGASARSAMAPPASVGDAPSWARPSVDASASASGAIYRLDMHSRPAAAPSVASSTLSKASKLKNKVGKALKNLFKAGGSKGGGAGDGATSAAPSLVGGASTFAGVSQAGSALEGLAALDGFSLAETSDTGMTHGSAATEPGGSLPGNREKRKKKKLWTRMKRKLGKIIGVIPRSWEVEALAAQRAAAGVGPSTEGASIMSPLAPPVEATQEGPAKASTGPQSL